MNNSTKPKLAVFGIPDLRARNSISTSLFEHENLRFLKKESALPESPYTRLHIDMRVYAIIEKVEGSVIAITVDSKDRNARQIAVKLDDGRIVKHHDMAFYQVIKEQKRLVQLKTFTRGSHWAVDCGLGYIETMLQEFAHEQGLSLEPDFQRSHVWNDIQRIRYVEYVLRGGSFSRDFYFNAPGWPTKCGSPIELVDGLQRLTALRKFMADELPAFGQTLLQWHPEDQRTFQIGHTFAIKIHVNDLATRAEVLQWYLDLNDGGTPHAPDEIARVRELLNHEPPS